MITKSEVLAMAEHAGIHRRTHPEGTKEMWCWEDAIERFHTLAFEAGRKAEREECAKVCEKRAETRWEEYGVTEDDTGASYYPRSHEWCDTADEEANDCATAIRDRLKPKFSEVGCSQCGQIFGPGNSGYSHCSDHSHIRARSAK